jgi:3-oxoacyl-[acyl-carrier protein] reductase
MSRLGSLHAAPGLPGDIVVGRFLDASLDDVRLLERGCFEAPFHFLKAVLPPMVAAGGGQVLVITSSSGARTTPGAPLYSSMRAGATHLVRNVAQEVARTGVQVNGLGSNFMDFPAFLMASNATTPEGRAKVESRVPMRRLGTLAECAALCAAYLDGTCGFVTGQFVTHDGGWSSGG